MCSLHLKQAEFAGWSYALWVESDRMSLVLVPQVGGRIMGVRWGQQDLFWVNESLADTAVDIETLENPAMGIWSNSMVRRPAQVFLPLGQTSVFEQGVKTFVNEGDAVVARSRVVSHPPNMAVIQCQEPLKFKFGVASDQGTVLTVTPLADGQYLGWISQFPTFADEPYGHDCTAEVFNAVAHDYLEVEIHSPVRSLDPGAAFTFTEHNRLVTLAALPTHASDTNALKLLGELC